MDKAAIRRWAVLLSILACTLAAIAYPIPEPDEVVGASTANRMPLQPARVVQASPSELEWIGTDVDPFASHGWTAAPLQPPVANRDVQAIVESAPPTPVIPALPYRFAGQMVDGNETVIYLSKGDQVQVAHQGEVLDGQYRLTTVKANEIEFEILATGDKQILPIPVEDK